MSLNEGSRREQVEIVNRLLAEVDTRSRHFQNLHKRFLLLSSTFLLNDGSTDEIDEKVHILADGYTELSESELRAAVKRLRCHMNSFKHMVELRDNIAEWIVLELLSWIVEWAYTVSSKLDDCHANLFNYLRVRGNM